jgi:hypothetical protein
MINNGRLLRLQGVKAFWETIAARLREERNLKVRWKSLQRGCSTQYANREDFKVGLRDQMIGAQRVYERRYNRGGTSARLRAYEARRIADRNFADENRESIVEGTLAAHSLRAKLRSVHQISRSEHSCRS